MKSEQKGPGGLAGIIEKILADLAGWSARRAGTALLLATIASALAISGARNLALDANLTHLLPKTFESVKGIEALEKRFGSVGYITIVGSGADVETLKRFAADVAPLVEAIEDIRYVDYRRHSDYFKDRALYHLEAGDIALGRKRLDKVVKYYKRKANPMYLDLEKDEGPPKIEYQDIIDRYKNRSDKQWAMQQSSNEYYVNEAGDMIMLMARPTRQSSDLSYSKRLVAQVKEALKDVDSSAYGPDFKIEYSGRFVKRIDQQKQIESDLRFATLLAFGLVLLYLGYHFRRASAVGLVVCPLLVGLLWTFGFTGYFFGTLNLLTGFVGAILTGLGIDHGIHLLGRYDGERSKGYFWQDAIGRAFGQTGRAVVVAGITTAVAFASLAVSEFRAFREFGIIAAMGVAFVILSYTVVLPALLGLAARTSSSRRTEGEGFKGLAAFVTGHAKKVFWIFLLSSVALASNYRSATFDFDFAALEDSKLPSFILDKITNKILGYSQTPTILLTDDVKSERAAAASIRARSEELGEESTVDFVAAVSDLVPGDQQAKWVEIQKLNKVLKKVKRSKLDKDQHEAYDLALRASNTPPFSRDSLPDVIARQFQGPNDTPDAGFVLIFPRISLSDGEAVVKFAHEMRTATDAPVAGEAMILADILEMLWRDSPQVVKLTLGLGLLALVLLLWRVKSALLCFGAALLTVMMTAGALPLFNLQFNYLNVVVLPVLFGLGVDGAVHMSTRFEESNDWLLAQADTARAVTGSVLTTGFGFGALLVADHPGLNSFGTVALIGLGCNLVVSLLIVPAFLQRHSQKTEPAASLVVLTEETSPAGELAVKKQKKVIKTVKKKITKSAKKKATKKSTRRK